MKPIPVAEILAFLKENPQGLPGEAIAQQFNCDVRNLKGRLGKLAMYGVLDRENKPNGVFRPKSDALVAEQGAKT